MDVCSIVTDRILKELERGVIPWQKPWVSPQGAHNRVTGKQYSLLNKLMLQHGGEYASYAQWQKLGGQVRRGESAEIVVFWKWPEVTKADGNDELEDEDARRKARPVLRYHRVFHISQIEGVKPLQLTERFDTQPIEAAESLFRTYIGREGIRYEAGESDKAFYAPARDLIHTPVMRQFAHIEEYYGTVFHEVVHSTGNGKRLARFGCDTTHFGAESYSKEELVAEIGSSALMHAVGIDTEAAVLNSAAYIGGWLSRLRGDKRFIINAASQAEKAVSFITGINAGS